MVLFSAEGLGVRFGGTNVLRDVTLSISRGEIVTIVGPNGSGKSTLLRALLGAVPLVSGRVTRAVGLRVGYVPQRLMLDPSLPLTLHRFLTLSHKVSSEQVSAILARVGLSADLLGRQMAALSGGQMQRALLARALLVEPDILILDEPAQGLDQLGEAQFYKLIEEIRAGVPAASSRSARDEPPGMIAILMVSHDLHVVMASSDRVICLNGHICCEGSPASVSDAPEYRALFGPGTGGRLALYQHRHDHEHDACCGEADNHTHPSHNEGAPL